MPKPYPYELRIRALKVIDEGMSISKVKKLLNISRQTLYGWKNIRDSRGEVKPKENYQKGHSIKIKDVQEFKELIDNNKDKSLKELAKISGKYSATTIWRGIKKLGYSYKKNFYSS
jgi:transposase